MHVLKETSRTFYIPITFFKKNDLKMSVAAAYLAMRAIDEIEDHEMLSNDIKFDLLTATSELLNTDFDAEAYAALLAPYAEQLPEVSLRLADWLIFFARRRT